MDGLFGDGLVDVLRCGGDSLEEDLRWGPKLGALVDLEEFEDGVLSTTELLLLYIFALTRKNFVNKHKTIRHLPIVHILLFKSLIDSTKNKAREQSPLYLKFRNSLNTLLL